MNILPAQRAKVTMPSLSGLAALSLAVLPQHHAAAPRPEAPPGTDVPAAVQQAQLRVLVAAARARPDAALPLYRVKGGQTMSGIAAEKCDGHAADWTGIYEASRKAHLTGPDANLIETGQELAISCSYDASQLRYAPAPVPASTTTTGEQVRPVTRANAVSVVHHRRPGASTVVEQVQGSFGNVNPGSFSGMQACIITRESGGNSQVMNSTGHYGLYQFSASTWAAHGGDPADFGHAGVAEQNAVFAATVRADGYSDWTPYDGC